MSPPGSAGANLMQWLKVAACKERVDLEDRFLLRFLKLLLPVALIFACKISVVV